MKIEKKVGDNCRVTLSITAPAEETKGDYDAVMREFSKSAPIPGFRRGKAPADVILRRYGKEVQSEVDSRVMRRLISEAIEQEKLDVVAVVGVTEMTNVKETGATLTALVDVKPVFDVPKYKGLPLDVHEDSVTDEDVDAQIEQFRKAERKSAESDEPAKEGDYVEVSFEATVDGKPIEGLPEESSRFAKADAFWLVAGAAPAAEAIPGSGAAMVGLRKGEDFSFEASFPADFHVEALRGVAATYSGKVQGVRALIDPTDDELVAKIGAKDFADLRARLTDSLKARAERAERTRLFDEISQLFLKKAPFPVPESETDAMARNFIGDVIDRETAGQEDPAAYVREHAEEIRAKAREKAEEAVRLRYIGDAIAAELGIRATKADVDGEIAQAAYMMSMRDPKAPSPEKLRDDLEKNGRMPYVESQIRFRKVVDWIIDDLKASK